MITFADAEMIARKHLDTFEAKTGEPLVITRHQEEPFGWVFFYQSKEYQDTGNFSSMLAGNGPFIVDRKTGAIQVLGTAYPAQIYIDEYRRLNP
jgi:hypothetical protein